MYSRLLDLKDFDQVARIYQDSNQHDKYRKRLRGFDVHEPPEVAERLDSILYDALKNLYLNPEDIYHPMWGVFDDNGKLLVYTGVRLDLPGEYIDSFCFAWMKGDPAINNVRNGAMYLMLKTAFDYCEAIGKTRWFWIIEQHRLGRYNSLAIKSTTFIDDRYDPYTLCEIHPGVKPSIPWVDAMIGRGRVLDTTYVVRGGRLKEQFRNSKS